MHLLVMVVVMVVASFLTLPSGILYLSRVPPFMKPEKVRHLLSQFGAVGRVYLKEEGLCVCLYVCVCVSVCQCSQLGAVLSIREVSFLPFKCCLFMLYSVSLLACVEDL
jgi:hypothetical protein